VKGGRPCSISPKAINQKRQGDYDGCLRGIGSARVSGREGGCCAANALSSTANFLKAHGWRAGAGYQPGEANFAAIQAWNAAAVYHRAWRSD